MSIGTRLTHTVSVVRADVSVDPDDDDEYGQPAATETSETVKAAIQPLLVGRGSFETPITSQGGAAAADHRIYLLPMSIDTSDHILHDAGTCPMSPDLPDGRYEIVAVPDAAGLGHHLEVEARLIGGILAAGS